MKVSALHLGFVSTSYTLQIIVLRLYPSVPINLRQALKPAVLPLGGGSDGKSPMLVCQGEAVGYYVYAMHRRKDLYGDDADEFRPSRWEADIAEGLELSKIGWGYLPLNGGPRFCLGRGYCPLSMSKGFFCYLIEKFAMLEASFVIVRLTQTFNKIELTQEQRVYDKSFLDYTVTLVIASANGYRVRLDS